MLLYQRYLRIVQVLTSNKAETFLEESFVFGRPSDCFSYLFTIDVFILAKQLDVFCYCVVAMLVLLCYNYYRQD